MDLFACKHEIQTYKGGRERCVIKERKCTLKKLIISGYYFLLYEKKGGVKT
jgi:hypothetical protein